MQGNGRATDYKCGSNGRTSFVNKTLSQLGCYLSTVRVLDWFTANLEPFTNFYFVSLARRYLQVLPIQSP